jgi:hypothetical protein
LNREEKHKAVKHKGKIIPHLVEITSNWSQNLICNPSSFLGFIQLPWTPPQNGFFFQGNKCSIHQGTEAQLLCCFFRILERVEYKWKPKPY